MDVCGLAVAHCAHRHRFRLRVGAACSCWFRRLRWCADRAQRLLAGVVLLASPAFMTQAPSEYADVPLAFFFLLRSRSSCRADVALPVARRRLFAGFAAWTKNEGALLVVALAAALFVSEWRSTGWRSAARQAGIFLLGASPGLLLVLWFKVALAPPDPLAGQMTVGSGPKALQRRSMA